MYEQRNWSLSLQLLCALTLVLPCWTFGDLVSCLQLLSGEVGGGNYTYYQLSHEGDVSLTLVSVHGDADIYASQVSLQPTFDLHLHDLQSVTCGADWVNIPAAFKRPVGIGIYGHPSHSISAYQLCVNLLNFESDGLSDGTTEESDEYWEPYRPHLPFYEKDNEHESLLWTILIGALKVLLEVLT